MNDAEKALIKGMAADVARLHGIIRDLKNDHERMNDLPCYFVWAARREGKYERACFSIVDYDGEETLPYIAWCPACRLRKANEETNANLPTVSRL